eukprot:267303-Lingulodinium_polyedra.AAC.1
MLERFGVESIPHGYPEGIYERLLRGEAPPEQHPRAMCSLEGMVADGEMADGGDHDEGLAIVGAADHGS